MSVLVLQHSDECKKPLSTIPLIERGLEKVKTLGGVNFDHELSMKALKEIGANNPILLYPGVLSEKSETVMLDLTVDRLASKERLKVYDSLIVLDGTWRNTREIVLSNDWLKDIPTLSLKNVGESLYRIRKSSRVESLSTIEAVSRILEMVDASFDSESFLLPFKKMIDMQISHMGNEVYQQNYCQ
jgi:DTW domain-containing protein YfiP